MPVVVVPKNQLLVESNVIAPAAGAKSVGGDASAPGSPRPRMVSNQAWLPLAPQPLGPPCPNVVPSSRDPTYTTTVSAGIVGLLKVCVLPVAGLVKLSDQELVPPGMMADSVSARRESSASAACCMTARRAGSAKKLLASRL